MSRRFTVLPLHMQFSKNFRSKITPEGIAPSQAPLPQNSLVALVGLTGLEPVTLRLSSACSNQLSYRPIGVRSSWNSSVWWSWGDSNSRPIACKATALPTELQPLFQGIHVLLPKTLGSTLQIGHSCSQAEPKQTLKELQKN